MSVTVAANSNLVLSRHSAKFHILLVFKLTTETKHKYVFLKPLIQICLITYDDTILATSYKPRRNSINTYNCIIATQNNFIHT